MPNVLFRSFLFTALLQLQLCIPNSFHDQKAKHKDKKEM